MNQMAKSIAVLTNRINCSADKLTVSDTLIMGLVLMVRRTLTRQSPHVNGIC
jgi:hypothetical protein